MFTIINNFTITCECQITQVESKRAYTDIGHRHNLLQSIDTTHYLTIKCASDRRCGAAASERQHLPVR